MLDNGKSHSPTINNFDSDTMDKSGTESSTNAGTFTITFTVKNSNYQFTGGVDSVERTWTVNKASRTITLSSSSVTLNNDTDTVTVTVDFEGSGNITLTPSDTTGEVCTATVSGKNITIKAKGFNTASFDVNLNETVNYKDTPNQRIYVNSQYCKALNNCGFAEIQRIIKAGKAQVSWKVGDYKSVGDIYGGVLYDYGRMMILGFNHNFNQEANGLSNYVDFALVTGSNPAVMSKGILNGSDTTPIASTDTDAAKAFIHWYSDKTDPGTYSESRLNTVHCTNLYNQMNTELKPLIVIPGKSGVPYKVWLLARNEIIDNPDTQTENSPQTYDYFKNGNSLGANYWLRTPYSSVNGRWHWYLKTYSGVQTMTTRDGSTCNGFLPCFRIG